ncbi:MAG: hypothetical protein PHW96_01515 [Candidatus Nanoarchaeia archaeon]|nr:hypothetical protein [Candidatus Nanoarchaeia archaeon]
MNKRAIEGLPLKYLVIVLMAALVIGLTLEVITSLKLDITSATGLFGATLNKELSSITPQNRAPLINGVFWLRGSETVNLTASTEDNRYSVYICEAGDTKPRNITIGVTAKDLDNDALSYEVKIYAKKIINPSVSGGTYESTESPVAVCTKTESILINGQEAVKCVLSPELYINPENKGNCHFNPTVEGHVIVRVSDSIDYTETSIPIFIRQ